MSTIEADKEYVLARQPEALAWWDEGLCAIRIPEALGKMVALRHIDPDNDEEHMIEDAAWANARAILESKEVSDAQNVD